MVSNIWRCQVDGWATTSSDEQDWASIRATLEGSLATAALDGDNDGALPSSSSSHPPHAHLCRRPTSARASSTCTQLDTSKAYGWDGRDRRRADGQQLGRIWMVPWRIVVAAVCLKIHKSEIYCRPGFPSLRIIPTGWYEFICHCDVWIHKLYEFKLFFVRNNNPMNSYFWMYEFIECMNSNITMTYELILIKWIHTSQWHMNSYNPVGIRMAMNFRREFWGENKFRSWAQVCRNTLKIVPAKV